MSPDSQKLMSNESVISGRAPRKEISTFHLLIGGRDVDTGKYEYFPYASEAIENFKKTREIIRSLKQGNTPDDWQKYIFAKYCVGLESSNLDAVGAAHQAYKQLRYLSLSRRRKIMAELLTLLRANRDAIIEIMTFEGHPRKLAEWEFLGMESAYEGETIAFYTSQLLRNVGRQNRERYYLVRKADGVLCVSPPKNAACSNSLLAAFGLLGGNAIVIKPPLHMPLSTIFLWRNVVFEALKRADAPLGAVNIVLGNSKLITDEWLASPLVSDLLYFGDSDTGLEMGLRAYQAGKKPILELSGNDMLLVWRDADLTKAAESLADGFLGSTQICMLPKKAIIHPDIFERFQNEFLSRVAVLKVGLPSDPNVCLTPVVKIKEFFEALEDALGKGAKLLCGGQRVNQRGEPDKDGLFITPAVLRIEDEEAALSMKCFLQENFFPLIPLVRMKGSSVHQRSPAGDREMLERMVGLVNSNSYGLRVSAWASNKSTIFKFAKLIQSGGLLRINSRHVGFSPFLSSHGGTGRTGGPYGEMNYVWQKTTHLQGITIGWDDSQPAMA